MAGTNFERCEGCPVVPEGQDCKILKELMKEIDVNKEGFRFVQVRCKTAEDAQTVIIYPISMIVIAKNGAAYGRLI
jgi:hypothetical protein